MRIYVAGPLFNEAELRMNREINEVLKACGHETYLPQEDGGEFASLPEVVEGKPKAQYLFDQDVAHLDWCDTILFIFDGRVPDEGACFELGYAYASKKRCIGFKTDVRTFNLGGDNLMLRCAVETTLHSLQELQEYFAQ